MKEKCLRALLWFKEARVAVYINVLHAVCCEFQGVLGEPGYAGETGKEGPAVSKQRPNHAISVIHCESYTNVNYY